MHPDKETQGPREESVNTAQKQKSEVQGYKGMGKDRTWLKSTVNIISVVSWGKLVRKRMLFGTSTTGAAGTVTAKLRGLKSKRIKNEIWQTRIWG